MSVGQLPRKSQSLGVVGSVGVGVGETVALGLGVSSRIIVEQWHGLPFHTGLGQIREVVQIVRLVAAGERELTVNVTVVYAIGKTAG